MSKSAAARQASLTKLEDMRLWKQSCDLAEHLYAKLADFPIEEKWYSASKIRSAVNDLLFAVAQGVGNESPSGSEYEWSNAKKQLFALKTMYRFAGRQHFIELEPEITLTIDALIELVNAEIDTAYQKTTAASERELQPWLRKYRLWKEMGGEGKLNSKNG